MWYLFGYIIILFYKIVSLIYSKTSTQKLQYVSNNRMQKTDNFQDKIDKTLIFLAGKTKPPECLVRVNGYPMIIRPVYLLENKIASGTWEPYVKDKFKVQKGEVIMDVGAHIGYYTIQLANILGKIGGVVSIEPDIRNFTLLKKNVLLNSLSNVTLINAAIGRTSCDAKITLGLDPMFSALNNKRHSALPPQNVKVFSIDDLVKKLNLKKLNWIKLDIEGGEMEALKGALNTIRHFCPKFLIEITSTEDRPIIQALFTKENYSFIQLSPIYFLAVPK